MKLAIIVFICFGTAALAEKPWPAEIAEAKFITIASSDLPKALQNTLLTYDNYSMGKNALPDELHVCRIHLGKGGPLDYIVGVPQGFSGGPEFNIFEERGGRFVEIGEDQGLRYFGPRVNGYYQIISQSRGGAGAELRTLLQFKKGRYRCTRMTDYQMQEMGGIMKFLRERSASEFPKE